MGNTLPFTGEDTEGLQPKPEAIKAGVGIQTVNPGASMNKQRVSRDWPALHAVWKQSSPPDSQLEQCLINSCKAQGRALSSGR